MPFDHDQFRKTDSENLWTLIMRVREKAPLIHNITNFVVMNNTANTLLAIGASPAMIHSVDEVEDFVAISQALVVNIGTLDSVWIAACKLAAIKARNADIPWIFDPVGAGATPYRQTVANALVQLKPTVIRGNGSEILSVAQKAGEGRGVDSLHSSETAINAARHLAKLTKGTVAITGAVDYVTNGTQVMEIHNGHPLMARVTGLGCSATAVIGAFLAVEPDAFTATVEALTFFGVAGELAAERSPGQGTLQVGLLDTLYALDGATFSQRAVVKPYVS